MRKLLPGEEPDGSLYWPVRDLPVPFTVVGGKLTVAVTARAGQSLGDPRERWKRLFRVGKAGKVRIDSLSSLRGRVQISSASEALGYVSLFTTLTTFYLASIDPNVRFLDVVDQSQLQNYPYRSVAAMLKRFSHGTMEVLATNELRALRIPRGFAVRQADGFLVGRPIVSFRWSDACEWRPFRMAFAKQYVARDGGVSELGSIDLGQHALHGPRWTLFPFE